ncbi:type II toxin-antitoxin system RelB/DinJ family antitoxin [Fusobacterium simiae]|uniref:type II toxin-antitoxin system RelB/DinJ family antitoxin n=1 Tax=Fusobacterium TaxID=848 RepID=UPI00041F92DE|nr:MULTISPECIES: type II toxin-antitoxin system RelB/DinJ family antitoxin [Fusobacterium]MDC7955735.1 type II toxin-antitoxin system RelB/DinJ family antitoxin [Fusobacterium simiae]
MATLTINTDEKTVENFYDFCEELGLDISTAITLFMKTCLREQKIPFELKLAKKEFVQNIKNAPTSIEELMENLDV